MSKTPMTDDVIAKLLAAPLSDEARKIIYEQALAFDDVPNLPKSDTVYTPEELKKRAQMKRRMDMIALSGGSPVNFDPASTKPIPNESPEAMRARYLLQSRGLLADFASYTGSDPSSPPDWDGLEKALEGEFPKGGLPPG